uniref:Uncharacterized protein n=1 Tax=Glossina austeni TaxID=7395 RepID=A0A1A9VYX6_GLOAU
MKLKINEKTTYGLSNLFRSCTISVKAKTARIYARRRLLPLSVIVVLILSLARQAIYFALNITMGILESNKTTYEVTLTINTVLLIHELDKTVLCSTDNFCDILCYTF